jgi:hypothetical protein
LNETEEKVLSIVKRLVDVLPCSALLNMCPLSCFVTCTCNVPLVATHSRNQSNNSTSSETVDGMLRNFWGQGNCNKWKQERRTK